MLPITWYLTQQLVPEAEALFTHVTSAVHKHQSTHNVIDPPMENITLPPTACASVMHLTISVFLGLYELIKD